ncbi:hypothetical protein WMY93_006691 [Mugilogobius chulae]|uniref:Replication stress response regulator SDE2 n=1 Tax=Mugilogobius chulae TaxID=88201 RepID=A0AAW0PWZ7_9GOBI
MAAVWVNAPVLGLKMRLFHGFSAAEELLLELERVTGLCDFYIVCNGRLVDKQQLLSHGSVYHLEPRLPGGKGGFGSMLRALGAQIEKTTNREACRDLSGRRLRDVNHEKEMAEWLKKQAEREAEKEQRRLERLQKKLAEPKHNFTDSKFTQQCHELSERLEDSVIKGLQASSSSVVRPESSKRPSEEREGPQSKKSRSSSSAPFSWTGLDLSSDEDLDQDSDPESDPESDPNPDPERATSESESSPGPSEEPGTSGTRNRPEPQNQSSPGPDQTKPTESGPSPDQTKPTESSPEPDQTKPTESGPGPDQTKPTESSPDPDQTKPTESSPEPDQTKPTESSPSPGQTLDQTQDQDQTVEQRPLVDLDSVSSPQDLDLDSVSCPEDLEVLGLNVLKEELMKRGLKCGGTLSERAKRLFSVKGKREGEIELGLKKRKK